MANIVGQSRAAHKRENGDKQRKTTHRRKLDSSATRVRTLPNSLGEITGTCNFIGNSI